MTELARIGTPRAFQHPGAVRGLAVSRDGRLLVTGGWDGRVRVWDVAAKQLVREAALHTAPILSVALSPDGSTVASAGRDKTVRVTDTATLAGGWTAPHEAYCTSVAFSPDGRRVASGCFDRRAYLRDVATAQSQPIYDTSEITCVAWTPEGRFVITGDLEGWIGVRGAIAPEQLPGMQGEAKGLQSPVDAIAVSPDGRWLAAGGRDNLVRIWDFRERRCLHTLEGHTSWVTSVAVTAERVAAGANDGSIRVWDAATGRPLITLAGHTEGVYALAFAAGTLVSAGDDGTVRLWDADSGRELTAAPGHSGAVRALAWGPALASGGDDRTVRFYNPETFQEVSCFTLDAAVTSLAWFGAMNLAAAEATGPMRVVMPGVGAGEAYGATDAAVGNQMAMIGDSTLAVSATTCRIWDLARGRELRHLTTREDWFGPVAVTPDGTTIVMGRNVALAFGGKPVRWSFWTKPFDGPPWTPDWDDNVCSLAFSPDGWTLVSGGPDGALRFRTIRGWDVVRVAAGHEGAVPALAFGRVLASGGVDGTVRLWDPQAGTEIRRYEHGAPVLALAFSPDGSKIASAGQQGKIAVWAV